MRARTWSVSAMTAFPPCPSSAVHVTVYAPAESGAVYDTTGPLPLIDPPEVFQEYVRTSLSL
jgi:hypothetical protein